MASAAALRAILLASFVALASSLSLSDAPSVRIGTRSSKLALAQAQKFADALCKRHEALATEIVSIDARGDQGSNSPIQQLPLAVSGVDFTGALDGAVLNGNVDVAVHSLKDIPPAGRWEAIRKGGEHLTIGAYLGPRETPLDALISKDGAVESIQTLPKGARVGSASIRRQAQLMATRPDLDVVNLRGNVDARLRALGDGEVDALILASAGLKRLGILDGNQIICNTGDDGTKTQRETRFYCNPIPIETMLPGVGQGIVAVACHEDNAEVLALLKAVDDLDARVAATTERAFLDAVQRISPWKGRPPVAGYTRQMEDSTWSFDGMLATPDGAKVLRVQEAMEAGGCSEERAAQSLGKAAGESVIERAGERFLDGYY